MQAFMASLRLIRWENLLIIILLQYLLRYMVILPLLGGSGVTNLHFFLLVMAVVLVAASRYAIHAYHDEYDDTLRKRGQPLLFKRLKKIRALQAFWLFNGVAVLLAAYLAYQYQYLPLMAILVAVPVLIWLQAVRLRKFILASHILLTFLAAAVPLLVWLLEVRAFHLMELPPARCFFIAGPVVYAYAFFTAMATLLREVLKDLEDYRMDLRARNQSLPVLIGVGNARKISVFLVALILVGIAFAKLIIFGEDMLWLSAYLLVAVILPFLLVLFMLLRVPADPKYCQIQQIVKLAMITGVLSMLVLHVYLVNGVIC